MSLSIYFTFVFNIGLDIQSIVSSFLIYFTFVFNNVLFNNIGLHFIYFYSMYHDI